MKKPSSSVILSLPALLSCVLYLAVRLFARNDTTPGIIVCVLVLGSVYLLLYRLFLRRKKPATYLLLGLLFTAGLISRLLLFGIAPETLSDDVYRYVWDGKVQSAGINPYLYAPADPRMPPVEKGREFSLINHPELPTSYPPLAQLFFRFLYGFSGGSMDLMRLIYLVIDFFCFFLIFKMVSNKLLSFLYFLCPLVIIETFIGLHVDILGVLFMIGMLYCLSKRWYYPAVILFAASVMTKYLFLAAGPVLLICYLRTGYAEKHVPAAGAVLDIVGNVLVFLGALAVMTLPYIEAGPLLFRQVIYYAEFWEFNAPIAAFIRSIFPSFNSLVRLGLLAGLTWLIARVPRLTLYDRLRLSILSLLLLNGALYPWYLIWLVPFFAFGDRWGELALVTLTPLSYLVLIGYKRTGVWEENPFVIALQYLPFILAFTLDIWKGHYVQEQQNSGYYSGPQRGAFTSSGS